MLNDNEIKKKRKTIEDMPSSVHRPEEPKPVEAKKKPKKVKKGDRMYYILVQTVLLVVMFFSLGMIGMKVYSYVSENEYYQGVINDYEISFENPYKNIDKEVPSYPVPTPERLVYPVGPSRQTLEDLKAKNPDFKLWLYIEDTNINYYVLQSTDNDFYLHKNINKKYFKAGSLFMDFRNNAEEMTGNTIIYGHNMHDQSMFYDLKKFLDKDFFDSHPYVYTYSLDEVTVWQIFSVRTTTTDEYYIKTAFSSDEQYYNFIEDFKLKSLYASDVILTAESDILTLTTCHKYDVSNGRLVVHAVKVGTGILAS